LVAKLASEQELEMMDIAASLAYLNQRERPLDVKPDPPRPAALRDTRGEREDRRPRFSRDDGRGGGSRPDGRAGERDDRRERPRPGGRGAEGLATYRIEVGYQHGVTPREIVGAIANEAGLEGRYIGRIEIRDDHALVDLPQGMPREIFNHLKRVYVCGQALRISLADGAPRGPRPEMGERDGQAARPRPPRGGDHRDAAARPDGTPHERRPKGKGFHQERRRSRTDPT
jgi:ATP-dependent RNA helicase DeaD